MSFPLCTSQQSQWITRILSRSLDSVN